MNKALEALEIKRDLIEYYGTAKGVGYAALLVEPFEGLTRPEIAERSAMVAAMIDFDGEVPSTAGRRQFTRAGELAGQLASALRMTATYWVDGDMVTLVNAAAPSMPDQPLLWADAPHEYGFALLDGNLYLVDGDEKIGVRAVQWRRTTTMTTKGQRSGFEVVWYSDRYDGKDSLWGEKTWKQAESALHDAQLAARADQAQWGLHRLVVCHTFMWFTGEEGAAVEDWQHTDRFRRWLAAFWTLVKQPVPGRKSMVALHEVQPDRPLRKRLERLSLTQQHVTFITLRHIQQREKAEGEDAKYVEWTHRWLVDGHWRNQYYPSDNTHRQIYINGYVKGPEDKPLRMKEKVYSWTR